MLTELTEAEKDSLRRSFKRCREDTVDAIINLRQTGNPSFIPDILRGIVWRYVHAETRPIVDTATLETPLASLGIDSLMMLEVVLDVQDALDIVIEDADLRKVQTIGDVNELLAQRFTEAHQKG